MNDLSFFLIVAGVAFLAGIVISSLVGSLRKPPAEKAQPSASKPVQDGPQYPPDAVHLWRDEDRQEVVLKIGQHIYPVGEPLAPKEQKYVLNLLNYLQNWLDTPASKMHAASSTPAEPGQVSPAENISDQDDVDDIDPSSSPSIVKQVNAILQQKLANSSLKDMGIFLMEMPDKGMVVMVGSDQYPDVDSVPDPKIKKFIQAAVSDWESLA